MRDAIPEHAKILIIDDEAVTIDVLCLILEREGYRHFHRVLDPRKALAEYRRVEPDLIVLDWMMPQMPGVEVLRQLRGVTARETPVPILVVTAVANTETTNEALENGATDFLAKPYDPAEIVLRITNLLRTRFLHLEIQNRHLLLPERTATLRDATAGLKAGVAEREQEKQEWKQSFDSIPDHICVLDLTGKIVHANKTMRARFEPVHGELVGLDYRVCYCGSATPENQPPCVSVLLTGEPVMCEGKIPMLEGWFWIVSYPLFDARGKQWGAVSVVRDITAQKTAQEEMEAQVRTQTAEQAATNKQLHAEIAERDQIQRALDQSQARFHRIAANAPGMVYQFIRRPDGSMAFPYVSEGSRELFGMEPAEIEADANALISRLNPADRPSFVGSVEESGARLQDWHWEGRCLLPSGREVSIQGASRPTRQPDGSVIWDGVLSDITARKESEAALRESEERFRQMAENMSDVFWMTEVASDQMIYVSPAYEKIWGTSSAEVQANPWKWEAALHPADQERVVAASNALKTTGSYEESYRIIRPDGSLRLIKDRGFPVRDENGKIYRITGIAEDITDRKRAQDELNRFFTLSLDMLTTAGFDGYFKQMNPSWETALGWTEEELTARPFIEFVHPDDQESTRAEAARLATGLETISFENRYRCRDGSYKILSWNARADLDLELIYAIARDVTQRREVELARRESEAKLRAIVDATPSIVFIKDLESNFLMVNRRFETLLGVSEVDIIGRKNIDDLPPAEAATIRQNDLEVLRHGRAMEFEETVRLADGFHVFLSVKVPLVDETGRAYALCGIATDITDRKRAELALLEAKQEAERANAAKSEFLSRMSHELRTPLNAILGFAQLFEMGGRDPEECENIEQILKGGRHLLQLINEVLDVARIEADKMALSIQVVPMGLTLDTTLALLRPAAKARGVQLIGAECELEVFADQQRLDQVLLNLVSNAIKYNREGGSVTLVCRTIADTTLRLEVRDTGLGIAADEMEKLFQPFERLGNAHGPIEGIGLGLTISQRLITLMGGAIGVESVVNSGSTFWIELPLAAAGSGQSAEPAPPEIASPKTLLYIEDNLSNLLLIERIMVNRPHVKMLAAQNGRLGLRLARGEAPDVILLDLHLSDIHGEEVLVQLRGDPRTADIPVVMISSDAIGGEIDRLLELGACAYLPKPFEVQHLLRVLDDAFLRCAHPPATGVKTDADPSEEF